MQPTWKERLRRVADNTTVQAIAVVAWVFLIWFCIFGRLAFGAF